VSIALLLTSLDCAYQKWAQSGFEPRSLTLKLLTLPSSVY
jgi:hypothetical protein